MSETDAVAHLSNDEMAEAIRCLEPVDWVRLRKIATKRALGKPVDASDLLQEAFRRALDGDRKCPADVGVVHFLAEAMRSIANGELKKVLNRPLLVSVDRHGDEAGLDVADDACDAEAAVAADQEVAGMKQSLLLLFDEDDVAQVIVEGMMEGMEGEELRELTDLNETEYQSKRRQIRRKINAKFPNGWTS